jgi:phosphoserine phosphatase
VSSGPPFQIVFFDCDSTLSAVEGIDELARRAGVVTAVEPLTRAAMEGRMPLEEVYGRRLDLIRPAQADINWLGACYVDGIVAGARETIATLNSLGKEVHIVSGGIRQAVLRLAEALSIPAHRVHAVEVYFDDTGCYAGYDITSPLTRSGGKKIICQRERRDASAAVLIGDGITDLEAADAGVFVIGFGGVARREAMVRGALAYVDNPSLTAVLDVILTSEEQTHIASFT